MNKLESCILIKPFEYSFDSEPVAGPVLFMSSSFLCALIDFAAEKPPSDTIMDSLHLRVNFAS